MDAGHCWGNQQPACHVEVEEAALEAGVDAAEEAAITRGQMIQTSKSMDGRRSSSRWVPLGIMWPDAESLTSIPA